MRSLHFGACREEPPALKTGYGLCQQMMHFFHNFRLYVTLEALEPAWLTLDARIAEASTLDQARRTLHRLCRLA